MRTLAHGGYAALADNLDYVNHGPSALLPFLMRTPRMVPFRTMDDPERDPERPRVMMSRDELSGVVDDNGRHYLKATANLDTQRVDVDQAVAKHLKDIQDVLSDEDVYDQVQGVSRMLADAIRDRTALEFLNHTPLIVHDAADIIQSSIDRKWQSADAMVDKFIKVLVPLVGPKGTKFIRANLDLINAIECQHEGRRVARFLNEMMPLIGTLMTVDALRIGIHRKPVSEWGQ